MNISQNKNQSIIPSLIVSLYAAWQQYNIPSIFYHYFLMVLNQQQTKKQVQMMSNELKLLDEHLDHYTKITDLIIVRLKSLDIIKKNIHNVRSSDELKDIANDPDHIVIDETLEHQGFNKIYETKAIQRKQNRALAILMTHLRLYRKITYQLIMLIYNWQLELYKLGYQGPIQFILNHQDYLQVIKYDTKDIVEEYSFLFENNPFLIIKRQNQTTQYALIYRNTRIQHQFSVKILQASTILSKHEAYIEKTRILGNFKQLGSRKFIQKSLSLHKIYCNYNKNHDYIIIKDPYLKSDNLNQQYARKRAQIKKLLINPQFVPQNYIEKRHPIYIKKSYKQLKQYESNKDEIKTVKINHKEAVIISPKLDKLASDGKINQYKMNMYQNLSNSIKYKKYSNKLEPLIHILSQRENKQSLTIPIKGEHKTKQSQEEKPHHLQFCYQQNIVQSDILFYLQNLFKGIQTQLNELQDLSKRIISQKEYITIIKLMLGVKIAGFIAVKFINNKDISIKKIVQLFIVYKFVEIPNFKVKMIEQFSLKGYNIIRQNNKIVHWIEKAEKIYTQGLKIRYLINNQYSKQQIKEFIKTNDGLKESKILKHQYQTKESKYHKYCQYTQSYCQLIYYFQELCRINIAGQKYIRARCDKISKYNACYRIQTYINAIDLFIGPKIPQILSFSQKLEQDLNQAKHQYQSEIKIIQQQYICFPLIKLMNKYLISQEKAIIAELISINQSINELLSITMQKIQTNNYLILEQPFFAALICNNKQDFGKILSIVQLT